MTSNTVARPKTPRPVEVIYSCSICQKTIHDLYKHIESDQGFRASNDNYTSEPVTKLWMTECAHLTCSEHLEGGGVPFHAVGKQPKLPCPYCNKHGDSTAKHLYGIRGFNKGQFDGGIPKDYFQTPPVEFKGDSSAMNALSFHYRQLCHFATNVYVKYHEAETRAREYQGKVEISEAAAQEAQGQVDALKRRVANLEHCEVELKPWKEREGKIKHYLQTFTEVVAENDKLREQMLALGYAVPRRTWSLKSSPEPNSQKAAYPAERTTTDATVSDKHVPSPQRQFYQTTNALSPEAGSSSSRTISAPLKPVNNLHTGTVGEQQDVRKRPSAPDPQEQDRPHKSPRLDRPNSRGLMPPPALPSRRPPEITSSPKQNPSQLRHMQGSLPQFIPPDQRMNSGPFPRLSPHQRTKSPQDLEMRDEPSNTRETNIFTNQESSPQRHNTTCQNYVNDDQHSEMPIIDPRRHGATTTSKPMNHQDNPRGSLEAVGRSLDNDTVAHARTREAQHVNVHGLFPDGTNLVHSDPGSIIYSPSKTSRQHSDPTQSIAPSPLRRPLYPRKLNDSVISPFFTENNRATSQHKRLTLPARARAGTSSTRHQSQSSQFSINNLSFINKPYNAASYERIGTGMPNYVPSRSGMHGTPSRMNVFVHRPNSNVYDQRSGTQHVVNAPFRPPMIQQLQTPYMQQQQQAYDRNFYAQQMTPQQSYRPYPAATPILMPSRMGTAAFSQGPDFRSRVAGFGYGNGGGGF